MTIQLRQGDEPSWHEWISGNLARGCDPRDMHSRMVAAGWHDPDASAALAAASALAPTMGGGHHRALPVVPLPGTIRCDGQDIRVMVRLDSPAVAVCENVLSNTECDALLTYALERGLRPSTVVDEVSGQEVPHPERTSAGLMVRRAETPLVDRIERRLAELTQWPTANGEGLQILRYRNGQEYRPHFDSFPESAGGAIHTSRGGQRVNTVLVYLRRPERGGATVFPQGGLTICPAPGSAILFRNVDGKGHRDPASLHAGQPVEHGEKVILTYWQRAGSFG